MRKALLFIFIFFIFIDGIHAQPVEGDTAEASRPDTVKAGIYITSIHDIDFKQKEYSINFWLWLKYKNKEFDFIQNLEIPNAKTVTKSFSTVDTSGGQIYIVMKVQCVMKDSWKIGNFPFDHQKLRLFFENSQYDANALVFVADTLGNHYDPRFTLNGWIIDSCRMSVGKKIYETAFGDESMARPRMEYSSFRVTIGINREAGGLFWKMFLGMYIAFFIAYVCFYIHADGIDSRFGLSVGALFAVIGNKYIIDSALPESTTFTLVDTLHGITLIFILAVVTATAFYMKMVKNNKTKLGHKYDMIIAQALLLLYIGLNIYFIAMAKAN
ncbi:MAG TPA: hypothetical protein VK489_11750 [Ferruginibacter sp.]|nr:hypothetical protein [Ferruginibacter sp.]